MKGKPTGWVQRTFTPGYPKYISRVDKRANYNFVPGSGDGRIVFCEDSVSMGAINAATGIDCCALLGTSITREQLVSILATRMVQSGVVWLDNDNWNARLAAEKLGAMLRSYGIMIRIIRDETDPKDFSPEAIKFLIEENFCGNKLAQSKDTEIRHVHP